MAEAAKHPPGTHSRRPAHGETVYPPRLRCARGPLEQVQEQGQGLLEWAERVTANPDPADQFHNRL